MSVRTSLFVMLKLIFLLIICPVVLLLTESEVLKFNYYCRIMFFQSVLLEFTSCFMSSNIHRMKFVINNKNVKYTSMGNKTIHF